jgi:hypothetical protein
MQVTFIALALVNILLAAASPAAPEAQGAKLAAVSAVSGAAASDAAAVSVNQNLLSTSK